MAVLAGTEPAKVFQYFEALAGIPHGSGNTKKVSDWLAAFARTRHLRYIQDRSNNIIIFKPASPGYEGASPVIIQGHMDMVCDKAPGCRKDMEKEGLELVLDGDTVRARDTTLGADDGVAVAMGLALLDDASLAHPPLEVVFTVDEELGMLGAAALDMSPLQGRRMINLDSEEEGVFTVSCAGGVRADCHLPVVRTAAAGRRLHLAVSGLRGGHSGEEIDKGRANAHIILGRLLLLLGKEIPFRLIAVHGGCRDNVISRGAGADIVIPDGAETRVQDLCRTFETVLRHEYHAADPDITLAVSASGSRELPLDQAGTERTACFLAALPDGVQAMSRELPGLVQTSLNLGLLYTTEQEVVGGTLIRSSVASQKEMLQDRITALLKQLGGTVEFTGDYAAWEYRADSPLQQLMTSVFRKQYGRDPEIKAIHAGVECGIFAGRLPGLDCISLGPTLTDIHTFHEKMHIASVRRTWKLLVAALGCMKE